MTFVMNFRIIVLQVFAVFYCNTAMAATTSASGASPEISNLIAKCAPRIHPETMAALIAAESGGHQYVIADAGLAKAPWSERKHSVRSLYYDNIEEAVTGATGLIQGGHTVSIGLTQVNDRNLKALGITIRDAFNACVNVAAGGKIFIAYYTQAVQHYGAGSSAMRAALSAYNSGDWRRGEADGYVDLVLKQRGKALSLRSGGTRQPQR